MDEREKLTPYERDCCKAFVSLIWRSAGCRRSNCADQQPRLAQPARARRRQPVPARRYGRRLRRPEPRRLCSCPTRRGSLLGPFAFTKDFAARGHALRQGFPQSANHIPKCRKDAGWKGSERQKDCATARAVCPGGAQRLHEGRGDRPARLLSLRQDRVQDRQDITNRAQASAVEGLDGVKGGVLGRYRMTIAAKEGGRPPLVPAGPRNLGKLGQPNGPSLDQRDGARPVARNLPCRACKPALEIEGPPASPPAPIRLMRPIDGPPEPPPYERNPDDDVDDIDFGP